MEGNQKYGNGVSLLEAEIGDEIGNSAAGNARDTSVTIIYGEEVSLCMSAVGHYSFKAIFAVTEGGFEKCVQVDVAWEGMTEENPQKGRGKEYADARAVVSSGKNGYWGTREKHLFFRLLALSPETVIVRYVPVEGVSSASRRLPPYNHLEHKGVQNSLEGEELSAFAISIKRTPLSPEEMIEGKKRKEREVRIGVVIIDPVPQGG